MSDTTRNGGADDGMIGGGFDQTNGLASGLDGESDGTLADEQTPLQTAGGDDDMGVLPVDEQDGAVAESLQQDADGGRHSAAADTPKGRIDQD